MKIKIRTADLGDDVVYCVGYTPTLTLLVVNSRPVTDPATGTIPAQRAATTAAPAIPT